ncbi:MAG: tetratricopeptide repeat protein [Pseudomonadota bacterium]
MSLINDVLKDLDRRSAPLGGPLPAGLPPQASLSRIRSDKKFALVGLLALVVGSAGVWLWQGLRPTPHLMPAPAPATRSPSAQMPVASNPEPAPVPVDQAATVTPVAADPEPAKVARTRPAATPTPRPRPSAAQPHAAPRPLAAAEAKPLRQSGPIPVDVEHPSETSHDRARHAYASAMDKLAVDPAGARQELESALALDPDFTSARSQLALFLWREGQGDDAIRLLRQGRQLQPQNAELSILLARLLAETQQEREALRILTTLSPAPDANPAYHGLLGAVARQQGQLALAASAYEKALRLAPGNVQWQMGLGLTLADLDRPGEARKLLQAVLHRLPPDSSVAAFLRQRLAQLSQTEKSEAAAPR